ncbi:MAG: pyrroloquinoline quinone precursor peptide PqqA [Proteobacteria bacterium]|nr:pyrroloquinoline quinone precursor peptide PqqA [Pseudomonadota bacterium]
MQAEPDHGIVPRHQSRRTGMRWETPQAIDFRFGMEITMYIARR